MNIPFVILWVIVIILMILFIIFSSLALVKYNDAKQVIDTFKEKCTVAYDTLPDISNANYCFIGDTLTSSKYVKELNMIVNPNPIYYLDVCKQYCIEGFSDGCVNGNGQENFNNCVNISKPKNCFGLSMPVAVSGTILYYPNSVGIC